MNINFQGRHAHSDHQHGVGDHNFPPSFRIHRSGGIGAVGSSGSGGGKSHSGSRRSGVNSDRQAKLKIINQLKKGTTAVKAAIPRIKDVNIIDKYSRVIFPVSFLLFNVCYWCFYVLEVQEKSLIFMELKTFFPVFQNHERKKIVYQILQFDKLIKVLQEWTKIDNYFEVCSSQKINKVCYNDIKLRSWCLKILPHDCIKVLM